MHGGWQKSTAWRRGNAETGKALAAARLRWAESGKVSSKSGCARRSGPSEEILNHENFKRENVHDT
eukprot:1545569-Pleurochrysis_carterae.AAC.1